MTRISGLDVNGWRDVAARDWDPDQDGDEQTYEVRILDGGIGSVAVRLNSGAWMGGPQALLAPHGRGHGWGDLGGSERRVSVVQSWEDVASPEAATSGKAFEVATRALARGAEKVVFAVPDVPECDEAAQGNLLATLRPNFRDCRLLWRPVAAFLDALDQNHAVDNPSSVISTDAEGALFRFFIHAGKGVDVQTLRLRRDADHSGHVAPERDGYGLRILPALGLGHLGQRAHEAVLGANPVLREGFCEESTLALRLICGTASSGEIEILRFNNGNWLGVESPSISDSDLFSSVDFELEPAFERLEPVAASFFITPLAESFAAAFTDHLGRVVPNLLPMSWDAIARGNLRAGRLIERGLPHYFDRLTPIRLAVRKGRDPIFEDLVDGRATLPANKEYESFPYRDLKWPAGKRDMEFYVLKGDVEVRHWAVHVDNPPLRDAIIELKLRQTPGQSWAKLSLTSPEWEPLQRSPIFLDWSNLRPVLESPEDVLEKLRTPPPTVPERIVELPSIEFWEGSDRVATGLISVLGEMYDRGRFSPEDIATRLQRSLRDPSTRVRVRPVGTDGTLPDRLPEEACRLFRVALSECEREISNATRRRPLQNNGALKSLTWAFTLCPETIQNEIVSALEADQAGSDHPLLKPSRARTVLIQGAGRAITGVTRLRRVLSVLVSREPNNNTLNAVAMILFRRKEAPQALTAELVEKIVSIVSAELARLPQAPAFHIRFMNTLSAIAGLFRYREIEPYALLAAREPAVRDLRNIIGQVDKVLVRYRRQVKNYEEKRALLVNIGEYLDGAGDPNILVRIESIDEGQDDDEED